MSWGGPESGWTNETQYDTYFTTPSGHNDVNVTFLAASGDLGHGVGEGYYPAFSPNVVAVGGTDLTLGANNTYGSEIGWYLSGGGQNAHEARPAYQNGVLLNGQHLTSRGIPDVLFQAAQDPGVYVYSDENLGWMAVGGTSVGTPCWAGLIAIADQMRVANGVTTLDGRSQTLPALYAMSSTYFHDIAPSGYDLVTGRGTPVANLLVPAPRQHADRGDGGQAAADYGGGTTTNLSVLGASTGWGESSLTYTWSATTLPAGAATPTSQRQRH